ncbi:hypothetical protein Egran_03789 [Elaphomyces granulatus]|uniref:Pseudouridine synthase I TruA alpha/beta domain-containing protein n=1 Tax=Elaphomyces granulatus TaxID=519963 RepID=A0A232LWQ1_9EURO|nr:hypothetical protein Egran_03789 [Elaphomyces granulatus]
MPTEPELSASGHGTDYSTWGTSSLIERITELERQLHIQAAQFAGVSAASSEGVVPAPESQSPTHAETSTVKSLRKTSPPPDDFTRVRSLNRQAKRPRELDPSKYHTRFIALKFAYLGQRYNGFEHTNGNITPLPTIEEELWKALQKTRLIFPSTPVSMDELRESGPRRKRPCSINWEGCNYSKCGRTDRGVSAFGQVIGIKVRSARPKTTVDNNHSPKEGRLQDTATTLVNTCEGQILEDQHIPPILDASGLEDSSTVQGWDDVTDELPYIHILNNVLPKDIRVLAWCPHPPPDFDARFSCRERQYRYFFTQPAFSPTPGPLGFIRGPLRTKYREGWLDIDAMREGAKYFEGTHDFRNFCKVDTSKQINNFERIIYYADIELVDPKTHPLGYVTHPGFRALECDGEVPYSEVSSNCGSAVPQIYTFSIHGSAFLWHQVRHMVAILLLVGQGFEPPSIIPELLNVSKNPRKPMYEMASDAPLVLWDCIFPDKESDSREDALEWVYAGDREAPDLSPGKGNSKYGPGGLVEDLWTVWRQRKIDETLAGSLLDLAVRQGNRHILEHGPVKGSLTARLPRSQKVYTGGNEARGGGKYISIMQKRKMDTVEMQNARYLANKERRTAVEENCDTL